jgi:hypothetical protein
MAEGGAGSGACSTLVPIEVVCVASLKRGRMPGETRFEIVFPRPRWAGVAAEAIRPVGRGGSGSQTGHTG